MGLDDWFLTADERGNSATRIDSRRSDGTAWTEGNRVTPLLNDATYFSRVLGRLSTLSAGHQVRFTDWRGDGDERLADGGPSIGGVLSDLARRGVDVRGLLWRSHSDRLSFSAKENRRLADEVDRAGGEVLLDERVRRGGSHHQKLVLIRHPGGEAADVAFVGGIDLSHGRRDDGEHRGDPQAIALDPRYGPKPPWHDIQIEVEGPAVGDLDFTFRERWDDPTPLDHSNPVRALFSRTLSRERGAEPLPEPLPDPPPVGSQAVQVLRTYPSTHPRYPFAPDGERSIARAFAKAVLRARRLIYLEDQYFWSVEMAAVLAGALERNRELHLIGVVPRYPDKDGRLSGLPSRIAQQHAMAIVCAAGRERVAFYDLENDLGNPIYVHAKTCVIDDVWATVGSDNLNRRSWTHDSELACTVIDVDLDDRAPADPAQLGDGARRFARDLRLSLWAEHLGVSPDKPDLLDFESGFAHWQETAAALARWHEHGGVTPRPAGQVLAHESTPVPVGHRWWAEIAYRVLFDPDGRPLRLRRSHRF